MTPLPISALRLAIVLAATLGLGAASFEVASIRPAAPDSFGSSGEDGRNGLLKVYNVSLKRCIRYASSMPETADSRRSQVGRRGSL
jgi:hypothetical protein